LGAKEESGGNSRKETRWMGFMVFILAMVFLLLGGNTADKRQNKPYSLIFRVQSKLAGSRRRSDPCRNQPIKG
jgi:hypothetical protein